MSVTLGSNKLTGLVFSSNAYFDADSYIHCMNSVRNDIDIGIRNKQPSTNEYICNILPSSRED